MLASRRRSRELALQILFQSDFTQQPSPEVLPLFVHEFHAQKELDAFTKQLVEGVDSHRGSIDELIREGSEHWSLERISRVDRTILRMAIFEILWCPDVPTKVSINEAIELAKKFSTEKSSSFINGILDRIAHSVPRSDSPSVRE